MTDSSAVSSPDTLLLQLQSLSVLRSLLQDPLLVSLVRALETAEETPPLSKRIAAYGELSSQVFALGGGNLSAYLQKLIHRSENPYLQSVCRKKTPSALFRDALEKDLSCLQKATTPYAESLRQLLSIPETVPLPGWEDPGRSCRRFPRNILQGSIRSIATATASTRKIPCFILMERGRSARSETPILFGFRSLLAIRTRKR